MQWTEERHFHAWGEGTAEVATPGEHQARYREDAAANGDPRPVP
jgi:hypothetical protein